ncbi:hypothetical protein H257_15152 [Aphanomyces astaci]|uniref:RNase H type-1 domain-containing protein n=1 Tax=Aphanomyces astaci TaxID=112090 RepID=W4FND8_APHAT|nr:hypothetical protein H257_15152 [Aphanomyces astaci]ETV69002.1 hypothetical protein H257_15152 [Aphanomyces astaci]|eukprot:XP_009841461.1 hypothetical protein H257_15152 [Aphanomyces astaci]
MPTYAATTYDQAHFPCFFMLSVGLGLQATTTMLDPQSREWFPSPPPRANLRRQLPFVKCLSNIISAIYNPPSTSTASTPNDAQPSLPPFSRPTTPRLGPTHGTPPPPSQPPMVSIPLALSISVQTFCSSDPLPLLRRPRRTESHLLEEAAKIEPSDFITNDHPARLHGCCTHPTGLHTGCHSTTSATKTGYSFGPSSFVFYVRNDATPSTPPLQLPLPTCEPAKRGHNAFPSTGHVPHPPTTFATGGCLHGTFKAMPPCHIRPSFPAATAPPAGTTRLQWCGHTRHSMWRLGAIAMPLSVPLLSEYDARFLSTTTNNSAEYDGLIRALYPTVSMRFTHVEVCGDSQLLMSQMLKSTTPARSLTDHFPI